MTRENHSLRAERRGKREIVGRPRKAISRPQPVHEFAEALEAARESLDMSQADLAKVLHFSTSTVSRWLTGATVPAADQIKPLANRLEPGEFAELERLRVIAAVIAVRPAVAETTVEHSAEAQVVMLPPVGRRPRWWIGAAAAAAIAGSAAVVVPIVGGGSEDADSSDTGRTTVVPVAGNPVYWQCTDRKRSILSAPGKSRGGDPVGALDRGAAFVVIAKTDYWRNGYVRDDPRHTRGWVMNDYLFPHPC
ncbi:helix-turn-helix domain-containing protein [Actinoplanes sp. KI2]|uniref:helix-turn-helix domain-containing protein n=1 Tax=Actinoplanes sp. KI2 TaxID=2983315 RepID=UPI0021D6085D|nr:helix-turn-helix transcriptional regulator [Actinoplanes sp. KI2]MCU7722650.1 helix-turn-helix domain-containing protein [Actinoplanes sp. KI2]